MAGIGFELRKILDKDSYISEMAAYLYAALISSGPWLMSIICLSILGMYRQEGFTGQHHAIFRSTIIYTYAASLIYVGIVQLVTTRYLADRYYVKDEQAAARSFFTVSFVVLCPGAPLAAFAYYFFALDFAYKFLAVILFLLICLIWLAMIFLSSIKDYKQIVYAFALGTVLSIAGAWALFPPLGLNGFILGYIIGQGLTFFWLMGRFLAEFPMTRIWDPGLMSYFGKFWDLALIGFVYNLAIWIDKFVFWAADDSTLIVPWFFTHEFYEGPVFISYLTIVPTLAIFLMKVETKFYEHYRDYYAKIVSRKNLRTILEEKAYMTDMLKENIREVFIVQGSVTLACLIFSPQILEFANLTYLQLPLLRIAFIGSLLQVLLAIVIIILFYFDQRKKVLITTMTFLISNWSLSWLSTEMGIRYYGFGYCYACFISLLVAFKLLAITMDDLEFITFAKQPLA